MPDPKPTDPRTPEQREADSLRSQLASMQVELMTAKRDVENSKNRGAAIEVAMDVIKRKLYRTELKLEWTRRFNASMRDKYEALVDDLLMKLADAQEPAREAEAEKERKGEG